MATRVWGRAAAVLAMVVGGVAGAEAQSAPADVERAALFEAEAARLQSETRRWIDAASLYEAAAALRAREDPQGRLNLFLAGNLYYQAGDRAAAVASLEAAGVRALETGDQAFAGQMFANAAQIAREAGLDEDHRRLNERAAALTVGPQARDSVRS